MTGGKKTKAGKKTNCRAETQHAREAPVKEICIGLNRCRTCVYRIRLHVWEDAFDWICGYQVRTGRLRGRVETDAQTGWKHMVYAQPCDKWKAMKKSPQKNGEGCGLGTEPDGWIPAAEENAQISLVQKITSRTRKTELETQKE